MMLESPTFFSMGKTALLSNKYYQGAHEYTLSREGKHPGASVLLVLILSLSLMNATQAHTA